MFRPNPDPTSHEGEHRPRKITIEFKGKGAHLLARKYNHVT
jgi:hypothetical protein